MSLVQTLGPEIPFLRRYARALVGEQKSGDAYVRAALEALVAGEAELHEKLEPKVALFRVFQSIWESSGGLLQPREDSMPGVSGKVARISPRNRQAFLLTAVEGFSMSQTASILSTDASEVRSLISDAQRDIESALATTVMIIEDEPIIAADIEALVMDLGHEVTAICTTRDEAVAAARDNPPKLILADIQLADGSSGIDAVATILEDFDMPVIFITAYPERLLTGERHEPAFLITKPFQPETVKAAIGQALFFNEAEVAA